MTKQGPRTARTDQPTGPVNCIDGIPNRSTNPAAWKYVLIGLIFLAWVAFLLYCAFAARI